MPVQDARDSNVQQPGFDYNMPHGVPLLVPLVAMLCRPVLFVVGSDDVAVGTTLNSFRKLLNDLAKMVEPLFPAELNGRKHGVLIGLFQPLTHDLICVLAQYV